METSFWLLTGDSIWMQDSLSVLRMHIPTYTVQKIVCYKGACFLGCAFFAINVSFSAGCTKHTMEDGFEDKKKAHRERRAGNYIAFSSLRYL